MNNHYLALELDKILKLLSQQASCEEAKEIAMSLEPSSDIRYVGVLLEQTQDAFDLLARFGEPSFSGLKNVENPLARASVGGLLNTRELLDIASTLRCIRSLYQWRSHCTQVKSNIGDFFDVLAPNKYLETKIFDIIISEEEISDTASEELFDIRRKLRRASEKVRETLDKMVRSSHYQKSLQEPIITQRNGRYVVPVKSECRGEIPGLVHDSSSSGATVFVEPIGVVEANNEIRVLKSKETAEIERILYELSAEAGTFSDSINNSFHSAVMLNLIFAKAQLAYKMKASKPEINDSGIIDLKNARHPLLNKDTAVPINISIGEKFDVLVITGPNTGGKTVSIKTIGLLTLMTMCGLMIPVSDFSKIGVFNNVLVDVGDEQSIEQNLSTFSAHMTNLISMMKTADENSLVLIDELGAGTDPVEGAALAVAILEKLRYKGSKIAATTHYAELKAYALRTKGVVNGSCEFDVKTLRPTYRLLIGMPGRSNAFAISERLGMDSLVVERARELVSEENKSFEQVVAKLEESRQALEGERSEAQILSIKAREISDKAEKDKQELDKFREHEMERAKGEAKRIVESARRQSQDMIAQLDSLRKELSNSATADMARSAKSALKRKLNKFDELINPITQEEIEDDDYVLPRALRVGDIVIVKGLGTEGEVVSLPDKKGYIEISAGSLKTRASVENVRLTNKKPKQQKASVMRNVSSRGDVKVSNECNLRGKTVDEALLDLDMFIDSAVMSSLGEITIIHGKGTGALRKAVQDHLKHHVSVKSYRLGVFGEGENGVTIVTLK